MPHKTAGRALPEDTNCGVGLVVVVAMGVVVVVAGDPSLGSHVPLSTA